MTENCVVIGLDSGASLSAWAVIPTRADIPISTGNPHQWPVPLLARISDPRCAVYGHDLKRTLGLLQGIGIPVAGELFDLSVARSLLDGSGTTRAFSSPSVLGSEAIQEVLRQKANLVHELDGQGQLRVFSEIEMPLIPVLLDMEQAGIKVDDEILLAQQSAIENQATASRALINQLASREVDLDSLEDIGRLLFEELKLSDSPRRTRSGQYATDADTLRALAHKHSIIPELLAYRELMTLKRTYLDKLPDAINATTGRIHTDYESVDAATGRLVSRNPNLQSIPIRTALGREIRKAFIPRDSEHLLLAADYDQVELRIVAALSHEPALLEALAERQDLHITTAAQIFNVAPSAVTRPMRMTAKVVNYSLVNGRTSQGLAQELNLPEPEAKRIMDHNLARLPRVQAFRLETIANARELGYVQTITGRRRYLPDIQSNNFHRRKAAERAAVSSRIQGSAADLIKLAMIRIHRELNRRRLQTQLLLSVHDELVFDLCIPEKAEVTSLVETEMCRALPLEVPLEVKIGTGTNWLEAH